MTNWQAHYHVKKGLFALLIGMVLLFLYQKWDVTSWLASTNNIIVTMLVVIGPLIALTEIAFMLYTMGKTKLEKMLDTFD